MAVAPAGGIAKQLSRLSFCLKKENSLPPTRAVQVGYWNSCLDSICGARLWIIFCVPFARQLSLIWRMGNSDMGVLHCVPVSVHSMCWTCRWVGDLLTLLSAHSSLHVPLYLRLTELLTTQVCLSAHLNFVGSLCFCSWCTWFQCSC